MYAKFGKRILDIVVACIVLWMVAPVVLLSMIVITIVDRHSPIFFSKRVGRGGNLFTLAKLRTMKPLAPLVATSELDNPSRYISPIGSFLRKTSLDELPQLFSVITGKMSLVGPRPALASQIYLCEQRSNLGIDTLRPGLTGLAQVNGRDFLSDDQKIAVDLIYAEQYSFMLDMKILVKTIFVVFGKADMLH